MKTAFHSILCLSLVALLSVHAFGQIGGAARTFPETRDRIRVFSDQLPSQLTEGQWKFVATHYVGSQKQVRSWTRHIRALNPNFIVLHYQLAVGNGPAEFIEAEKWTNDFANVQKHEDWFLHDAQRRRLHQTAWNWYVMNILFKDGKSATGYPAYWTDAAIQRMRKNEDDGCFADSYTQDIVINQLTPTPPLFHDIELTKRDWLPSLNQYGAYCTQAFHRQPEKFYFLPNFGGMTTTWDKVTDYLTGDGGMNEGLAASGPGQYHSLDDWKLNMSRLLHMSSHGKIVICQTATDPSKTDHCWFIVGSFLLTKGRHSYLNMFQKSSLEWYPEYDVSLGPYVEEPKENVDSYWRPDWQVYRRDYSRGFVLVNPSDRPVTIERLGQSVQVVRAEGGGAVGANGETAGKLIREDVSHITIPAHSARVFLKAFPERTNPH